MSKLRNIGGLIADYKSPKDFTATYTSSTTITLSSLDITITDSSQIVFIVQIKSDNTSNVFQNGLYGVTISIASNILTVHGTDSPFASGDVYRIGIDDQKKGYDSTVGGDLVHVINQPDEKYIDAQTLVSATDVGAVDDTWVDCGSEIGCNGYKTLGLYVNYTRNHSTGSQLQILSKHESAGSDEYVLETSASYQKTIGDEDIKVAYFIDVIAIPYVQLQTKATNVTGSVTTEGTVTIDYVLEY